MPLLYAGLLLCCSFTLGDQDVTPGNVFWQLSGQQAPEGHVGLQGITTGTETSRIWSYSAPVRLSLPGALRLGTTTGPHSSLWCSPVSFAKLS